MTHKAQEASGGGVLAENLREELEDCKTEQQVGQTARPQGERVKVNRTARGAGRGSTVADPIQIWVLHMGNHSPTKAESLQAERYFRFTRSSAGLSCHRSIDSLLTAHLRHRRGRTVNGGCGWKNCLAFQKPLTLLSPPLQWLWGVRLLCSVHIQGAEREPHSVHHLGEKGGQLQ